MTDHPDRLDGPDAQPARRFRPPGWRDPRLVVGLALVAVCVLAGGRLMAGADETEPVWALRRDLPAGAAVTADDLRTVRARLPGETRERYYLGDQEPGSGRLARDLRAGELLARSALAGKDTEDLVEVPVSVAGEDVPRSVRSGSTVDVWVTASGERRAKLALEGATVVSVSGPTTSLAPQTTRQVILGVPAEEAGRLGEAIGSLAEGRVVVVRRAGGAATS